MPGTTSTPFSSTGCAEIWPPCFSALTAVLVPHLYPCGDAPPWVAQAAGAMPAPGLNMVSLSFVAAQT